MRGCLFSATFAVLVNGNAKGWVKTYKGLRQGDPFSPFPFTLVTNVLSKLIVREKKRGLFKGFLVGRNRPECLIYNLRMTPSFFLEHPLKSCILSS